MQFKKLLIPLMVCVLSFSVKAQDIATFPVNGLYAIQYQNYDETKIFNRVLIDQNTITLKLNEVAYKHYRIFKVSEAGYHVELYFPELDRPLVEREEFIIKINGYTENDVFGTLIFEAGRQEIELLKVQ